MLLPQDGSDVLQFQRFRVFHPLPKQAHHGILKTLWDKRVQWNQGLNARRTKQLLQAFLDQDVRLGIPSQALPLPATAPRALPLPATAPAVTALPASSSASTALPAASAATSASAAATTPAAAKASSAPSATAGASQANGVVLPQPQSDAQTSITGASRVAPSVHSPTSSPGKPLVSGPVGGSTPVAKQPHQRKARDPRAAANRKLALPSSEGQLAADPSEGAPHPQPDFTPLTPTSTADHPDAVHAVAGYDNPPTEMPPSDVENMPGDVLPSLPPLHLSKAQHRSVRTDDGEEVHVLVSPVRSQGGDDSPSSPSRLPDSVLKAMCNMGKAFLSRYSHTFLPLPCAPQGFLELPLIDVLMSSTGVLCR